MILEQMDVKKQLFNIKFKNDEAIHFISGEYITAAKKEKELPKMNEFVLKQIMTGRIIPVMRHNSDYKTLFEDILYRERGYRDLEITTPNAYNLYLLIKLPLDEDLKVETDPQSDSIKLRIVTPSLNRDDLIWSTILTDDNYLDKDKLREYIYNIFIKVLKSISSSSNESAGYKIKTRSKSYIINRKANNAFEIKIKNEAENEKLIFDIVPCVQIGSKCVHFFKSLQTIGARCTSEEKECESDISWTPLFFEEEKKILKGHIKPMIRIIKKLRNCQNWTDLKCAFIENLVLQELDNPEFRHNYDRASRTCIFVYLITRLQQVLENGKLINYWHPGHNLLESNKIPLQSIACKLEKIINQLNVNPNDILKYFHDEENMFKKLKL